MPFDGTELNTSISVRIREAVWRLESLGWCQKTMIDEDGRVCLLGAFNLHREKADLATKVALSRVAALAGCDAEMNIWQFNDGLQAMTGKWALIDLLRRADPLMPAGST